MKGNTRMENIMVKGHTFGLMEENMLGNGRMGKQNGHGTVTSPYWKYVGEWKGNDFHGQGTMISTDGTKWVGEFRENKRWNIREYDNNGNLTTEWVNGVEQTGIKWKTFGNEKVQPKYEGKITNMKPTRLSSIHDVGKSSF